MHWCLMLLLLLAGMAEGQTYRWTDEDGKTHFSDQPPPTGATASEELEVQGPAPIGQGRDVEAIYERTRRLRDAEAAEQQKQQAQERREQARATQKCARMRDRLRRISGRFMYRNEQGERYEVSEEQAEQDREELRQWLAQHCS